MMNPNANRKRRRQRQMVTWLVLLIVAAVVAQVAGVTSIRSSTQKKSKTRVLAILPGTEVPSAVSTDLSTTKIRVKSGETVQMGAGANLVVAKVPKGGAQVVCGIYYTRAKDPAWTLGSPYETFKLTNKGQRESVRITRSFVAPVTDTYSISSRCHISAPKKGVKIAATGAVATTIGLPTGSAEPVG